jgi:xylulokinase
VRDAETGKLWGRGRHPHPPTTPPRSEQNPSSWWAALVQSVHDAARYNIAAISVAGQQHGMVATHSDGTVLRPAKLWNDTESATQAQQLVDEVGAKAWAAACGSVPVPAFTVTKLAWLRDNEPDAFHRLGHVLLPHDWLTWRLTGRMVTDRGDASGTGYWSPAEGRWRPDLLRLIDSEKDWADALPSVLAPMEVAGPLQPSAAKPLGMQGLDVVVGPGTGDNMAAALGIGLQPGDLVLSVGTSGTAFAVVERATADPSGAVAGFADATGRFLPLVCTLNATKVTDAFARFLGVDETGFSELALSAPAGANGVVLVPYLDGERTPNRPDATGTLAGVRSNTTRADIARAAVEGVVCGLLDGVDALAEAGVPTATGRVFLVGGGARSAAYQRVVADLTQWPIVVPDLSAEHVATGACVQAAAVLQSRPPEEVAADWKLGAGDVVEPDSTVDAASIRAAYTAMRDRA